MRILPLMAAALMAAALQGCFTGIESTPRITASDARRAGVKLTDENIFAQAVLPESPRSWAPGKQWKITDDKIGMLFAAWQGGESLAGKTMSLACVDAAVSLTGDSVVRLSFAVPGIAPRLRYVTDVRTSDWRMRPSFNIPFTVEMSAVATADSLMRGNTYYILTSLWTDGDGRATGGLHHIPVRIEGVRAGTEVLPLMVAFTPLGFGDNAPVQYVYMTYGTGYAASRNFDKLFSFSDPRQKYPLITDENWNRIVRSTVARGMTRNEVRLALGTPDNIDRGATRGGFQMERWSYSNGMYLVFEEDVLISYGR